MKIKLTYLPEEETEAAASVAVLMWGCGVVI